jgi:hypothetical protein
VVLAILSEVSQLMCSRLQRQALGLRNLLEQIGR